MAETGAGGRRRQQALTMVASKAFGVTDAFNQLHGTPFPGWRAEAVEPAGPSTGGGKNAVQHVSLLAPEGGRLAIGSIDWAAGSATLRGYGPVSAMHGERFRRPFPITAQEYLAFLERVRVFLSAAGVNVRIEDAAAAPVVARAEPQPASSGSMGLVLALVGLLVAAATAVAVWWWLARR